MPKHGTTESTDNPETTRSESSPRVPRRRYLGIVGATGVAALAGCTSIVDGGDGGGSTSSGSFDAQSVKFNFEWVPSPDGAGFYIAMEKGYWAERGLSVQVNRGFGSDQAVRELGVGNAQFATASMGAVYAGISRGLDLQMKSLLFPNTQFGIITHPDSGIEEPADLEGTRLAISPGGKIVLLKTMFNKLGLDYSSLDVETRGFVEQTVLTEGDVDWLVLSLGSIVQLIEAGFEPGGAYNWLNENLTFLDKGLLVNNSAYAEDNPEAVRRFIDGALEGWRYALSNGEQGIEEATDAMLRFFPEVTAQEVPEGSDVREVTLNDMKLAVSPMFSDVVSEHGLGYIPEDAAQQSTDMFNEHFLENSVTTDQVYDLDYMESGGYSVDYAALRDAVGEVAGVPNPFLQ